MKRSLLKLTLVTLASCGLVFVFGVPHGSAAILNQINFQGKLTNTDGTNVADGNFSIRFRIYTDPTADALNSCAANSCKWEETQGTVAVSGGLFNASLGSVTTLPGSVDFNSNALYLGIKVGADSEMTPRVRLTAVPQAFNSDMIDGLDSSALGQLAATQAWTGTNTFQPTTNITGLIVKQTSNASPTADIFNIQTANGTSVMQVTGPSANNAAVTISSVGGSSGLTIQSGSGTISLGSTTALTATGALSVNSGGTTTLSIGNGGTANTVQVGNTTGAVAQSINIGTNATASSTSTVTIGSTVAGTVTVQSAATINIGNNAVAQTINIGNSTGATAVDILCGTGVCRLGQNAVAHTVTIGNVTGASAVTIDSGTGAINIGTGAQARAINLGTGGAVQTVIIGSTNGASATDIQAGTGGIDLTTQGTGAINIGNNAVAQTINIGNATGTTAVSVLCGSGVCGFGNNAIAHATTLGSTTGAAATTLQAGTGGISITSGGNSNIVLGTSDTTATLLVLDTKTTTGDPTGVNGGIYYNSADNDFRAYQNGQWANIQPVRYAYLSADRTNSTTAYADVTDLSFAVGANANYEMVCSIIYQTAATTTGIGIALNGPASPNLVSGQFVSNSSATALNGRSFNAYNGTGKTTGVQTANTNTYGTFRAYFRNGATAGTLQVRFASEVGSSNAIVKANSYCRLSEL